MIKNILMIGSGWLGFTLAEKLNQQGFKVTATTTSPEKVVNSHVNIIHLDTQMPNTLSTVTDNFDLMLITIPPKRGQADNYLSQLMALQQLAVNKGIGKLLFISSTSVWGENLGTVTEHTPMLPSTDSARAMVDFEQFIHQSDDYQATSLKLAGLIGDERYPGRFLAGKTNVSNSQATVNLVTKDDVIGIIIAIITKQQWQQSFIACSPSHPTREAFYTAAAHRKNLTPPQFNTNHSAYKSIDASLTAKQLNYRYQTDNLMHWLQQ